jgi:predicted AAA+ superfamily ATPase
LEQLIAAAPSAQASFYRTSNGAEVDLVLEFRNNEKWIFEIKRSSAPTLSKGFYIAGQDLQAKRRFLVAPVGAPYPIREQVEVVNPWTAVEWIAAHA